jgi:hypothetical protein
MGYPEIPLRITRINCRE